MRFSWLYHHLDYLRSIRLDAATLPHCHAHLFATLALSKLPKLKREASSGGWKGARARQWTMPEQLAMTAVNCILASISYSSLLPLPPLSLSHSPSLARSFSRLSILNSSLHKPLGSHCFGLKQRTEERTLNTQRSSTGKGVRERESERGQRSQALPFCAQHYSLNLKLSLKLWSISRFTAPKCRKFAHSFGSLVGNLSKSIKYIHTYVYIS